MKPLLSTSVGVAFLFLAVTASAQYTIVDGFNSANGDDISLDAGTRASAPGFGYSEKPSSSTGGVNDASTQIAGGALRLSRGNQGGNELGTAPSFIVVSPNVTLADLSAFTVAFDVSPGANVAANSTDWASLRVGDLPFSSGEGQFVNNGSGFGMLFRQNGGYQVFNGSSGVGTFDNGTGINNVAGTGVSGRVLLTVAPDAAITGNVLISVSLNGVALQLTNGGAFSISHSAFAGGNIELGTNEIPTTFDNLTITNVSSPAPVPEPATMAALGLGVLGFARRRARR